MLLKQQGLRHSIDRRDIMAAASTSTSDNAPSQPTQDQDQLLDVSILKELARKALIDALNSVCSRNAVPSWIPH